MADTLEKDFIVHFHSLYGTTIEERTINLYSLLNKTKQSIGCTNRRIDWSSLHPTTPLEEHFKIKALIHFKCVSQLFEVLKTENPLHIDQVLKQSSWFIKEAFADITPENLTEQIFPNMSYCTKLKVLNKLAYFLEDTDKCDQYFNSIRKNYGLYMASKLLASCSLDLIVKCIELYNIEITDRQLLSIVKRYPSIVETILEKLDKQNLKLRIGDKYKNVFKYLAKQNVNLFLKLYHKYSPNICLGTKETDTFIQSATKINPLDNTEIRKILKSKQIRKSLGNNFKEFFYKCFPKRICNLQDNLNDTLDLLDGLSVDSEKLKLFCTTFEMIYGNEIWEYSSFKVPKLIEWMTPDEREVWMEKHSRPTDIWEESWISYYKTRKSIPLLKDKILLLSSIKGRTRYILALLKTCRLNKDNAALLDVLKYVNAKHRNDNFTVIQDYLSNLNNSFKADVFTEEHWAEINECVQLFILNNGCYYYCRELLEKYIFYRLAHNLPVTENLQNWAKEFPGQYSICETNIKFQKFCFTQFEALVPLGYKKEELDKGYISYLVAVHFFNEKHPKNKLFVHIKDEYVEMIKGLLEIDKNAYDVQLVASDLIKQNYNKAEETGIVKLFLDQDYCYDYQIKIITWLFKKHTNILIKHFDLILNANCYQDCIKLATKKYCIMYTHLNMPQTVSRICYNIINDNANTNSKIRQAVLVLSMVSTPDEFISFTSSYYPTESSPSISKVNNAKQNLHTLQQTIAGSFSNVNRLSQIVNSILQFCKGDYLKFALRSLVIASCHTIENKFSPCIDSLKGRAVSVRKHALFLSYNVLNVKKIYDILLEFMQDEKNASIRKVLFKIMLRMFLQNPGDYSWELSKQCMSSLDFNDEEVSGILTSYSQIPYEYFGKFLTFSWNVIDSHGISNKIKQHGKLCLLNLAQTTNISALPNEFCITVIEQNLFKCQQLSDVQKSVQSFTCKYLIHGTGNETERLQFVFGLLKDFRSNAWKTVNTTALTIKLFYNFVKQLCNDIMDKNCSNKIVFEHFFKMWESTIQPYEACNEFILLQLTLLYLSALDKKLNTAQIGEKVALICNSLYKENCLVVCYFANILKEFLHHFYELDFIGDSDESQMILVESIVKNGNSYVCSQLALSLMPSDILISAIIKQKYDDIINVIMEDKIHLLQVSFQDYLKNTIIDM